MCWTPKDDALLFDVFYYFARFVCKPTLVGLGI